MTGDGVKDYAAGFAAGIATVITGHPFDTVKVKLQKHNTEAHGRKYRNGLHCTARILSTEGVRGLYKGATSSFIGMAFESSLLFGIYSQAKAALEQGQVQSDGRPHIEAIIPSAAYGGAVISLILCPSELIKCRIQVQGSTDSSRKYVGPLDCALKTVKGEGIKGLFRGGITTCLRESIGNAIFFTTYEFTRYYMMMNLLQLNSSSSSSTTTTTTTPGNLPAKWVADVGVGIVSGGLAGIAFWSSVLPLDVAKTIIQTDTKSSSNPFYTLRSIYTSVGVKGCYAGLGPTIVRAFPANAAAIVTWELTAKILGINNRV